MSRTRLAVEVGIGENMMYQIETDRRDPSEKTALRLSEVLEIPMDQLISESNGDAA